MVKNPPTKAGDIEPSIQSLDWEDPLEEDMATSVFLPGKSHGQRSLEGYGAAAAAAKSLQSYPTLCDRIDGCSPGSSVHGILQARVLEWGAIAFSNA